MTRIAVALAVVLAAACAAQRTTAPDAVFDQAQDALRRGDTSGALGRTVEALSRLGLTDDSTDAWRLRLLHAEILITRREFANALAALERNIPDAPRLSAIRARKRYLDARLALSSNDLARAIEISAEARDARR